MMKIILFTSSMLMIIAIIFLKLINNKQKLEIKNLTCICDSTKTFRHDFNNIMQAIGGYIQTNNIYDLKKYYNHLIPECLKVNNLYRFHSKLIGNPAIYSIISNKYNLAEQYNVKMSLNILLDLNSLKSNTYTLTRILGILLDNAIEAAKECPQKIVNVTFQEFGDKQLLIIENTYLSKGISAKKIFEKHFTTKQGNSGLGLWQVKRLLDKNKNLSLKTILDKDFFTQKLEIS